MPRNRFTNPATGVTWTWPIGHSDEQPTTKTRSIQRTANTAVVGAVRQQGDDGPIILKFSGTILQRVQLQQFWAWYALGKTQSIFFYDFDDQGYEVLITELSVTRKRKLSHTGRDPSMPFHFYTYDITMEVLSVLQGDMVGVGP